MRPLSTEDSVADAVLILQGFHEATATRVRDQWWDFFFKMVAVYRSEIERKTESSVCLGASALESAPA